MSGGFIATIAILFCGSSILGMLIGRKVFREIRVVNKEDKE